MVHFDKSSPLLKELYTLDRFESLRGTLSDKDARYSLIDFLRYNLDFTVELLFGIKLLGYQSVILKNWFDAGFSLNVWARGGGKSFLAAIFVLLYPIFYPGTRIILASNVFRSSRRILETAEKLLNARGAELLKQCYPHDIKRATDLWSLSTDDGGFIRALPLNERIRGERADILIVDEFLLVPKATYENILLPFLNARNDVQQNLKLQEEEDRLIKLGYMDESQRTILESDKKIIALTSASYDFEYCFEVYNDWISKATGASDAKNSKYFVSRLSYLALPSELIEEKIVEEAKSGGSSSPFFNREYMALFHKGSDGFFSMKHMYECTIPDGETPCVQAFGSKDQEYLLSIDPSFSSGKTSDYFAMAVFLVDKVNKNITLVNSYAIPGGQLKDHIGYLYHILTNFNIVLIAGDFLGGVEGNFNFLEAANQSELFKNAGINLKSFDGDMHQDGEDYIESMKLMRKTYNKTAQSICCRLKYTPQWIKRSNEYMQYQIQAKKIWFASRIVPNEDEFDKLKNKKIPVKVYDDSGKELSMAEYLDEQDNLIQQTKNQIALIEPKISAQGNLSFDLPASIKAIKGEKRARRDSYTVTLMACWAAKVYFDYLDDNIGKQASFRPFFLN